MDVVAVVEVVTVVEVVAVVEVVDCSVGGHLCWFSSLCGGRPFVYALSIRQPTGCYALILIHPFLLQLVDIPLCGSFLSISAKIGSGRRSCTLRNYLL